MSCSSSDDDDPAISSPDASSKEDNSDDDDYDVFACKTRNKFQKSTVQPGQDESSGLSPSSTSPSERRRRRQHHQRDAVEDRLSEMDRKKRFKKDKEEDVKNAKNRKQSGTRLFELSDDESDDGFEILDVIHPTTSTSDRAAASMQPVSTRSTPSKPSTAGIPTQAAAGVARRSTRTQSRQSSPSLLSNSKKPTAASPFRRSPRCKQHVTARSTSAAYPKAYVELVLDESSDEENVKPEGVSLHALKRCGASKDVVDTLERSRQAASLLRCAQAYKAEDIEVEVIDDDDVEVLPSIPLSSRSVGRYPAASRSRATAVASSSASSSLEQMKKSGAAIGKILRLTCRTLIYKNDSSKPTSVDKVLTLGEQEPLQVLRDKCLEAHSLSPVSTTMILTFDGTTLNLTKTPMNYEMEDEDMIHFEAKTTATASQSAKKTSENARAPLSAASFNETSKKPATTANLGKSMRLTCRTLLYQNDGSKPTSMDKVLTMRENEPLQVLRDKCMEAHSLSSTSTNITLRFDGMSLILTNTPMSYEMEDEDMIEVEAKPLDIASAPNATATFRLRKQNGKKITEHTFQHGQQEPFQDLMVKYRKKTKVTSSEALAFRYAGTILDLTKTPVACNAASGGVIDVAVGTATMTAIGAGASSIITGLRRRSSRSASRPRC